MEWITAIPEKDGTYVVKTKTTVLFRELVMNASIHTKTDEKVSRKWNFHNQTFVAYLKE
jgi:hypothetical protein